MSGFLQFVPLASKEYYFFVPQRRFVNWFCFCNWGCKKHKKKHRHTWLNENFQFSNPWSQISIFKHPQVPHWSTKYLTALSQINCVVSPKWYNKLCTPRRCQHWNLCFVYTRFHLESTSSKSFKGAKKSPADLSSPLPGSLPPSARRSRNWSL